MNRMSRPVCVLLLFGIFTGFALSQDDEIPGPMSPEESLKAIKVAPGLKVELVAAEPLVEDPVAFDWAADGRLWVIENLSLRERSDAVAAG